MIQYHYQQIYYMKEGKQEQPHQTKHTPPQALELTSDSFPHYTLASSNQIKLNSKQCRICLQNDVTTFNQMVDPCRCIGTVKYVHDLCFRRWIQKQISEASQTQLAKLQKQGVQCQLCKAKMELVFSNKYKCSSSSSFSEKYTQNPHLFYLFIFFFLLNFACIVYLAYNTTNNPLRQQQQAMAILIIIGFIFLIATALLVIYYFMKRYLIQTAYQLQRYQYTLQAKRKGARKNHVANEEILP